MLAVVDLVDSKKVTVRDDIEIKYSILVEVLWGHHFYDQVLGEEDLHRANLQDLIPDLLLFSDLADYFIGLVAELVLLPFDLVEIQVQVLDFGQLEPTDDGHKGGDDEVAL